MALELYFDCYRQVASLICLIRVGVQSKVNGGAILESSRMSHGNPTMTRASGDVSRSAIFGVVRRTLFELHMCGLFHYTCLADFWGILTMVRPK